MLEKTFWQKNIDELVFDIDLDISPIFKEWVTDIVYDSYLASPTSEHIILEKLAHIFSTVTQGRKIITGSGGLPLDSKVADLACLLHDIGRFREAENNEHLVSVTGFDHADYGARIFEQKVFLDFPLCENNKKVIAEAIRLHDKDKYDGNSVYVKLVRDADKLDNLLSLSFQIDFSSEVLKGTGVSKLVFDKFLAKELMPMSLVKSEADFLIYLSSWLYDIYFDATYSLLREGNFEDIVTQKLKELGINDSIVNEVKSRIVQQLKY